MWSVPRHWTDEERFWVGVWVALDPDGCWEWLRSTVKGGYGVFTLNGRKPERAHVFSYELHHGPVPAGLIVTHTCDNPPCTNPRHLVAGTHTANNRDAVMRGRRSVRLTPEQVRAIRVDTRTQRDLAQVYGVVHSSIARIRSRKAYAWVD